MSTYFMNLTLPSPRTAPSPTWATQVNAALTSIDSHDHTSGLGQALTSAGININTDLALGAYGFASLGGLSLQNRTAFLTTDNSVTVKAGELIFRDAASNNVQLTTGGAINVAGIGSIKGDYASSGATLTYTNATRMYLFQDSNAAPAGIIVKAVVNTNLSATGATLAVLTANGAADLAAINLQGATTVSGACALNGNNTGRGIIPVGGVVALASNLTGVTIPTGYSALDGSTISDATSPMNGVTLPNINSSVFLMGSTTAGTTGGANSYSLVEAQLPAHVHTIDNDHADTMALSSATGASQAHTHNIAHDHQFSKVKNADAAYGLRAQSTSDSSSTVASTGTTAKLFENDNASTITLSGSGIDVTFLEQYAFETWFTSGVHSGPSGSGSSAVSGTPSATSTVAITGSVTTNADNSGSVGSGSSVDNRPAYITTQYIVRVK